MRGQPSDVEKVTPEEFVHVNGVVRFSRIARRAGTRNAMLRVLSTSVDRTINPCDRRFGTDTGSQVGRTDIASEVGGHAGPRGSGYVPMVASAFSVMLREFAPNPEGLFVDIGSGRGRCVILALEHGFQQALGIEYSGQLCKSAQDNLERSGLPGGEICECNATMVELPPESSLVFMYNPFSADIWKRVLNGPIADLDRPVSIATHAMPHALTVESDTMTLTKERKIWRRGRDFTLLTARPRT